MLEDAADFEEFLKDTEIYWDYVDEDLVREKRAQETCLKIYLSDDEAGAKQYAALRTSLENLKARDEEHAWGRLVTETALTRQEDWEGANVLDSHVSYGRAIRPCRFDTACAFFTDSIEIFGSPFLVEFFNGYGRKRRRRYGSCRFRSR